MQKEGNENSIVPESRQYYQADIERVREEVELEVKRKFRKDLGIRA